MNWESLSAPTKEKMRWVNLVKGDLEVKKMVSSSFLNISILGWSVVLLLTIYPKIKEMGLPSFIADVVLSVTYGMVSVVFGICILKLVYTIFSNFFSSISDKISFYSSSKPWLIVFDFKRFIMLVEKIESKVYGVFGIYIGCSKN